MVGVEQTRRIKRDKNVISKNKEKEEESKEIRFRGAFLSKGAQVLR